MSEQPRDEDGRFAETEGGSPSDAEISSAIQAERIARTDATTASGRSVNAAQREKAEAASRHVQELMAARRQAQDREPGRNERMIETAARVYGEGSEQHEWAKSHYV